MSAADTLIAKLGAKTPLDHDDRAAICALSYVVRHVPSHAYLARDTEQPLRSIFLMSGFAHRYKLTAAGDRQIVGLMIPGDFVDLHHLVLPELTHSVQSLTRVIQAEVASQELLALAARRPAIGRALTRDMLVQHSMACEAIVNIGQRDGPTRLAHLICEFETRIVAAGLGGQGHQLPMTQEQIADATGLHEVHAHRTLKLLEQEGLILRDRRTVKIIDWAALQRRARFDPRYLYL